MVYITSSTSHARTSIRLPSLPQLHGLRSLGSKPLAWKSAGSYAPICLSADERLFEISVNDTRGLRSCHACRDSPGSCLLHDAPPQMTLDLSDYHQTIKQLTFRSALSVVLGASKTPKLFDTSSLSGNLPSSSCFNHAAVMLIAPIICYHKLQSCLQN